MSYQVFARKTRPRNFSEVVGQSHVLQALANGLDAGRVHHAFLFTGTRGVGKTTIARIFAKALNCEQGVSANPCGQCANCVDIDQGRFVDLMEIDAASRTGVDDMRELIDNVQYAANKGRYKVYLIDEVHMLSTSAFNALLKTLEEPPEHVKFLLATTDPQKIPVTVLSRCLQFSLRRLSSAEIQAHLATVLDNDGVAYDQPALRLLARAADGSVRDSLSLLDQALNYGAGKLTEAETRAMLGTVDETRIASLIDAVVQRDAEQVFAQIEALQTYGFDWRASLTELAALLQRAAVYQQAAKALPEDTPAFEAIAGLASSVSSADIQLYYQIAISGLRDLSLAPEPRAGFEMTLLRMLAFHPAAAEPSQPATEIASSSATMQAAKPATTVAPKASVSQKQAAAVAASEPSPSYQHSAPKPSAGSPSVSSQTASQPAGASSMQAGALNWSVLVNSLPLKAMALELANNTTIVNQSATHLTLGISEAAATVCPEGVRQRMLELVQQRLPEVKIEVELLKDGDAAVTNTPAAKAAQAQSDKQVSAQSSIEQDPNIKQLVSEFDGQVEADSIKSSV